MIGSLSGVLSLHDDPYIIIDVAGVGYKVLASAAVLKQLPLEGESVKVFTYTHVREDALELYGFEKYSELKLFELLLSVSGIGPKTALGVFALGTSSEISNAIITGNVDFFVGVPRLGKKNAQKIIIELKNKFGSTTELDLSETDKKANEDILTALRSFGYSTKEAGDALKGIDADGKSPEEKIKLALKYLGK